MSIEIFDNFYDIKNYRKKNVITIGISEEFNQNNVVSISLLCLCYIDSNINIIRSYSEENTKNCDICIGLGSGKFDYKGANFNQTRSDKSYYSGAGLIWKRFGKTILDTILSKYYPNVTFTKIFPKKDWIDYMLVLYDSEVIKLLDYETYNPNSFVKYAGEFSYIYDFIYEPNYFNEVISEKDLKKKSNEQFLRAVKVTNIILEEKLRTFAYANLQHLLKK